MNKAAVTPELWNDSVISLSYGYTLYNHCQFTSMITINFSFNTREESEAGSINQSEAGASFKTEKDGIIAVEVGKDREKAIENEYQPVGGMNFHNPIYNK